MSLRPFHIALPVADLEAAKEFYTKHFECRIGRTHETWMDLDFFGHQLVFHEFKGAEVKRYMNPVDGDQVPVPHLGVVLEMDVWKALGERLKKAGIQFEIEPSIRFEGLPGEQAKFFFFDPNGIALEFKGLSDDSKLFQPNA